jgi:hypothetical protein
MKYLSFTLAVACLVAPAAFANGAAGNTLYVANDAQDSGACGGFTAPCRSISQAIVNARAGDTIVVRPGRYGDRNFDGAMPDYVGEESGTSNPVSQGAVRIDKRLTIVSSDGAEATIIDAFGAASAAVEIAADGVRFGEKNAGFTLAGGSSFGLVMDGHTNVVIAGNITRGASFAGFLLRSSGVVELRQNTATGMPGQAFWLIDETPGALFVVTDNTSFGNGIGMTFSGLGPNRVTGNHIFTNDLGLSLTYGPSRIAQNQLHGNFIGVRVSVDSSGIASPGLTITRNNIFGSRNVGLSFEPGAGAATRVRENNFVGNQLCGTNNRSDLVVDARNNYWGASSGPGFLDPANDACSFGPQTTQTMPFAAHSFDIR